MANLPHIGHPHAFLSTIWSLTFEECLFLGVQGFQLRLLWCRESLEVKATGIILTYISMSFFSGPKFIKIHSRGDMFLLVPQINTWRQGNSITFWIQQATNLSQITFSFNIVFNRGSFHKESIHTIFFPNSFNACTISCCIDRWLCWFHEGIQFLVGRDSWALKIDCMFN